MGGLPNFLSVLFAHLPPGYIETRIIEDKKGGQVVERRWYESADRLLEALEGLNRVAEAKAAAVFFGVLPRISADTGKGEHLLPGLASWTDQDFRDFSGGESDARQVLAGFPLPPSTVIHSGHGLHPYWFMREPTDPGILAGLSKRLALTLHGDHVGDAARVMRLPGTFNRKDPAAPIEVRIEHFDPDRRYNPCDFEEYLLPLREEGRIAGGIAKGAVKIGGSLSLRVIHLLDHHPQLQGLFEGRGKTAVDDRGRRLDTSSSGYDYSIMKALVRKGVRDETELASVLWLRPDEAARAKGVDYILRTVRKALADVAAGERAAQDGAPPEPIDFTVQQLRVFASNPRKYEFTVDGASFEVTTPELLKPSRFRVRLMDALGRVPTLPRGGPAWTKQVAAWLEAAEVIEQPPEASQSGFLKDAILRAISELRSGENVADLDRGLSLLHKGQVIFKTEAVWRRLKESFWEVSPQDICSQLHDLDFVWRTPRIDGKTVRVWARAAQGPEICHSEGEE